MIKYKKGNLIELAENYDIILHGVNCFCKMGDGIALELSKIYPEVIMADLKTTAGDRKKLGTYSKAFIIKPAKKFYILNCYTQYGYAGMDLETADLFDYKSYEKIIYKIAKKYKKLKIAMPLIGAGHAGGDINKILSITHKHLKNNNLDIIIYKERELPPQYYSLRNKISLWLDKFNF